jgi:hypothetical protein
VQILCQASPATRAARLAARATDATRHRAHQAVRIDAQRPTPGYLELPGARILFISESVAQGAFAALCARLDDELPPACRGQVQAASDP